MKEITQMKQSMYLLKINYKNYKHLVPAIFEIKFILKKMILKKNSYFSPCTNILKELLVLVVVIIFIHRNPRVFLMKILDLLLNLIIALLQNEVILVIKQG